MKKFVVSAMALAAIASRTHEARASTAKPYVAATCTLTLLSTSGEVLKSESLTADIPVPFPDADSPADVTEQIKFEFNGFRLVGSAQNSMPGSTEFPAFVIALSKGEKVLAISIASFRNNVKLPAPADTGHLSAAVVTFVPIEETIDGTFYERAQGECRLKVFPSNDSE